MSTAVTEISASGDPGDTQQARQEQAWDDEATRTYTDAFTPLVPLNGNNPATRRTVREFLDRWKSEKLTVFCLAPPHELLHRDGREDLLPPFDFQNTVMPWVKLSDSNLGTKLRAKLGMQRMGWVDGKYRRAEVFGWRATSPETGAILSRRSCHDGFFAWHCLVMQVMNKLGCPTDPRYWLAEDHPVVQAWQAVVQAWQATRDRLVLQSVTTGQPNRNRGSRPNAAQVPNSRHPRKI